MNVIKDNKLYFSNMNDAYRILRKARKHNCKELINLCEWCIECMEYDQYLMQCAL